MTAPAVEAHDVFCLYATPRGYVAALRGLSLTVPRGERLVVHGPNGSGKTTLLRVLAGERPPSAGSIRVAGVDLVGISGAERSTLLARDVGLVDQQQARSLRPELDVLDNVALQLRIAGTRRRVARAAARDALGRLGLADLAERSPSTLSGGEAQRVAVCAAVAHGPSIVLADEPTGELDRTAAESVYALLAEATEAAGATLVLVTHDARAAVIADRVVRIRDGRLSEEWEPGGSGETLVVDDRGWVRLPEPLRRSLGVGHGVRAGVVDGGIVLRPDGAPATAPLPRPVARPTTDLPGAAAVAVACLDAVRVERVSALADGVTLEIQPGRLLVVQGPSGSGKTTLLRVLAGLQRPDGGRVTVQGTDLATLDRAGLADLRRSAVAVSGQSVGLVDGLDVVGNLALARDARGLAADDDVIEDTLHALGLHGLRHRAVGVLSGGERQRAAVARALVVAPPLALLDEPTSQQDEANAEVVVAALLAATRAGTAVVVASHDPVLVDAADLVLRLG